MKKFLATILCATISLACLFSSACVYHQHDVSNDTGFCKGCEYDIASLLEEQSNGSYLSQPTYYENGKNQFFNIVGNGKTTYSFEFEVHSGTPSFNYIYIYKEGDFVYPIKILPEIYHTNMTEYDYQFTFEQGVKYRIRITSSNSTGTASLKINML